MPEIIVTILLCCLSAVYANSPLTQGCLGRRAGFREYTDCLKDGNEAVSLVQREAKPLVSLTGAASVDGPPAASGGTQDARMAALLDNRMPHVTVDARASLRQLIANGPPRYVLSANTGHAGSTSLSKRDAYVGPGRADMLFRFEDIGFEAYDHYTHEWLEWWNGNPSDAEQLRKVRDEYKVRVDKKLKRFNRSTYVDLGHHTLHGIWHQIPKVFMPNVVVLRLRRDRYHTAYSFANYRRDLCENMFRICPLYNEVVLRPPAANWTLTSWSALNYPQQALWYVDEVEVQWQLLVRAHPQLPRLECDWSDNLDTCFAALALVLHLEVANAGRGVKAKPHTFGGFAEAKEHIIKLDQEYKKFMNYSAEAMSLMARTQ